MSLIYNDNTKKQRSTNKTNKTTFVISKSLLYYKKDILKIKIKNKEQKERKKLLIDKISRNFQHIFKCSHLFLLLSSKKRIRLIS